MFFSSQSAFPFYASTAPYEGRAGVVKQRVINRVSSFPGIKILNRSVFRDGGPFSFFTAYVASLTDLRG